MSGNTARQQLPRSEAWKDGIVNGVQDEGVVSLVVGC